jgi:hypothetical protein
MSEVLKQSELDKREKVTVIHPDFGHVIFSGATARQIEILEHYTQLVNESKVTK